MNKVDRLEFENIGSWPWRYRLTLMLFINIIVCGLFFYYCICPKIVHLTAVIQQESILKNQFKEKVRLSVSLPVYQSQLTDTKAVFSLLLKQFPNKKEAKSLLNTISVIGIKNGLQFRSINWNVINHQKLMDEASISIKVIGHYSQLGQFCADIAALPHIVVLDELKLTKHDSHLLALNVKVNTYSYKGNSR